MRKSMVLFDFILFHLFSAELRDRQRKHQGKRQESRKDKNGNKENEVSEASAVKSCSEQEPNSRCSNKGKQSKEAYLQPKHLEWQEAD